MSDTAMSAADRSFSSVHHRQESADVLPMPAYGASLLRVELPAEITGEVDDSQIRSVEGAERSVALFVVLV